MSTLPLNVTLKKFAEVVEKPTSFFGGDKQLFSNIKTNIKEVYDFTKQEEIKSKGSNSIQKLFVQNLDSEQIWQQIELQNENILSEFVRDISHLVVSKDKLFFKNLESIISETNNESEAENQTENDTNKENTSIEELEVESDTGLSSNNDESTNETKKAGIEDNFFNISEMEKFLDTEDKKESNPNHNDNEDSQDSEEDEDSIDLFEQDSDASEEQENEAKTAKFKDYFVAKESNEPKQKKNKFLEELDSEEETNMEEKIDEIQSSLELRQQRLKKKIEQLEGQATAEKSWVLKGEIAADKRPQNSLLEEIVGFDLTSRPAPVITEQSSLQLEDIIKQRIKSKVFDSVERKIKPIETPLEYRKKLVLDQEKSKKSLAQIYEEEFNEKRADLGSNELDKEQPEPESHKEIKSLMTSLFSKLDSLSNFYFTCRPIAPELKVINNLPAINMEEVAPVAASDANLLAPEEVRNKPKGFVIGKNERTSSDKKRDRRKKKLKQKVHAQLKVKKEQKKLIKAQTNTIKT